jgi:hypothetical protein
VQSYVPDWHVELVPMLDVVLQRVFMPISPAPMQ